MKDSNFEKYESDYHKTSEISCMEFQNNYLNNRRAFKNRFSF